MIDYDPGQWGLAFMFRIRGSVLPKALVWAIPSGILGACFSVYMDTSIDYSEATWEDDVKAKDKSWVQVWTSLSFLLGFLLVFRTQQAYTRFWEGGTIMQQVRGEWYNAASSTIAFCTSKQEKAGDVEMFQHTFIRLMSMLHCAALQQVSSEMHDDFEILDFGHLDTEHLTYLSEKPDKCEILLSWVQRMVVQAQEGGVITAAPPIVSRVYQELSRGIVGVQNAKKMKEIPFPFPYAQIMTVMLLLQFCATPVITGTLLASWYWSAWLSFVTTLFQWSIHYTAMDIEDPFNGNHNDLPLLEMQRAFNESLWSLMEPPAQQAPRMRFKTDRYLDFGTTTAAFLKPTDSHGMQSTTSAAALRSAASSTMPGRGLSKSEAEKQAATKSSSSSGSGSEPLFTAVTPSATTAQASRVAAQNAEVLVDIDVPGTPVETQAAGSAQAAWQPIEAAPATVCRAPMQRNEGRQQVVNDRLPVHTSGGQLPDRAAERCDDRSTADYRAGQLSQSSHPPGVPAHPD